MGGSTPAGLNELLRQINLKRLQLLHEGFGKGFVAEFDVPSGDRRFEIKHLLRVQFPVSEHGGDLAFECAFEEGLAEGGIAATLYLGTKGLRAFVKPLIAPEP